MNTDSYWQQFASSGKIEDYLAYSQSLRDKENSGKPQQEGERPYAGNDYGNRNDFKPDAYR